MLSRRRCCCGASSCITEIRATGCDSILSRSVAGATVNVYPSGGGSLIDSGTTASDGTVDLDVGTAGTYLLEISHSRFATYSADRSFTCGGSLSQTLTPASGYHCLDGMGCSLPFKDTLYASHPVLGTVTLSWSSTNIWLGGGTFAYGGCSNPSYCLSPPCAGASVGYTMSLSSSGGVIGMAIEYDWTNATSCPGGSDTTLEVYAQSPTPTCSPLGFSVTASGGTVKKCLYCSATTSYVITVTE